MGFSSSPSELDRWGSAGGVKEPDRLDVLGIEGEGRLVVVELKRAGRVSLIVPRDRDPMRPRGSGGCWRGRGASSETFKAKHERRERWDS
jgi:hypothetical protein